MAKLIDIHTTEMSLSDLVSLALSGTNIIFTEGERHRAHLLPMRTKRIAGLHEGAMRMSDDFLSPLPDTSWTSGE